MPFDIGRVSVQPLTGLHQLDRFVCSHGPIQEFCRHSLADAHAAYQVRAFVAVHDQDPRIVGYYYLCLSAVSVEEVGPAVQGGFLHVDAIPAVYLGMFGVHRRLEQRGIGKVMMRDVLVRVSRIAQNAGTYALTLDAVDEAAAGYYEQKFDFQRFRPGGLKMFLEMPTILELGLGEDGAAA